jgi:hypothetical protein
VARTRLAVIVGTIACHAAACAATPPITTPSTEAPTAAAPLAADASAQPRGSPSPAIATVSDILTSERGAFEACYAAARAADLRLGQTSIVFSFDIDAGGKPITVDLQYRHRMDDSAKECMRDAALALSFPPSMQGRQTATLTFRPAP